MDDYQRKLRQYFRCHGACLKMVAFDLNVEIVLEAMLDLLWSQSLIALSYDALKTIPSARR